jgi:hypothetical protein
MQEFLFKSNLIFTTMGSSGERVGKFRRTKRGGSA